MSGSQQKLLQDPRASEDTLYRTGSWTVRLAPARYPRYSAQRTETVLAEPVTIIKVMTNMIVARITMIMNTLVTMNAG